MSYDTSSSSTCHAASTDIPDSLSRHFSLSFIASGRSSGLQPISLQSCCMYVRAGRPAFERPYVGVHWSTSLTSSSLYSYGSNIYICVCVSVCVCVCKGVPTTCISSTLSSLLSLSTIAHDNSSWRHPVSEQSRWMYLFAGQLTTVVSMGRSSLEKVTYEFVVTYTAGPIMLWSYYLDSWGNWR